MSKLPNGWTTASLGNVTRIVRGITFPAWAKEATYKKSNVCCLRTSNIQREVDWDDVYFVAREYVKREEQLVIQGDILMSMANSYELVGKVAVVRDLPYPTVFGAFLSAIRTQTGIERQYLFHLLRTEQVQSELRQGSSQTVNIANISVKTLSNIKIPIAPLNEQKRIANKLSVLLAQVDACRERLDRIPLILKRFRQAVLRAATSGQLTQDWRTNNFQESGSNNYNISGKLADFAEVIDPNPSHRYPSYKGGTIPILATEQMSGLDGWDISSAKLTTSDFYEARKAAHDFLDDDIIFARKGRLGLARNPPQNSRYVFSHTVFIVRAKADKILPAYLLWFLRQEKCIQWLLLEMNSNAGVPTLGKSVMERLPVQIPDYVEQQEIVCRIENLFAYADRLEARYQAARAQVERLTPALLAKAFRGELVSQDPNDEPASLLLERIRAERAAQPPKPKRSPTPKKPTMTKMTEESVKEAIQQLPKDKFSFDELRENLSDDYDSLKDILFALLSEAEPSLTQVFDREEQAMRFVRVGK